MINKLPTLKSCSNNHNPIMYDAKECPLCVALLNMDDIVDAKTDIDQDNIFDLFSQVGVLNKRVRKIEQHLGIQFKRHFWSKPINNDDISMSEDQTQGKSPGQALF